MKFTPAEMDENLSNLWPEGVYKFKVTNANDIDGNYGPQIALELELVNQHKTKRIKDWLSAQTQDGKPNLRLMFFCRAVGLFERYKSGEVLDGDCIHKVGYLHLVKGKSSSGDDVNKIAKYLTEKEYQEEKNKHNAPVQPPSFPNDDVPF